jgi:transposase
VWHRHDRLSVIGALCLAPQRQRIGLYFRLHDDNINAPAVVSFLRHLHQRLRRKLIVVWDRLNVHRSAAAQLKAKGEDWLQVEWLPAYAPELNPVEAMWSHTKVSDLANFVPDDVGRLEDGVVESLSDQYYDRRLKRGYFHAARLEL